MRYLTITMLAEQAGKSRSTITRALKAAGIRVKVPGCKGGRISARAAALFLAKQWPPTEAAQ